MHSMHTKLNLPAMSLSERHIVLNDFEVIKIDMEGRDVSVGGGGGGCYTLTEPAAAHMPTCACATHIVARPVGLTPL